jgi:hypothetical protein
MQLSEATFRHAAISERMRRRVAESGFVGKNRVWTVEEDQIVRQRYPDLAAVCAQLPGRSRVAIVARAGKLQVSKPRFVWTAAAVSKLRRHYGKIPNRELMAMFPGKTMDGLRHVAQQNGIRAPRRRFKSTGFPLLDAVRDRCFDLNYSMLDLDELAMTGRYFRTARWRTYDRVSYPRLCKAVEALGGTLGVDWGE